MPPPTGVSAILITLGFTFGLAGCGAEPAVTQRAGVGTVTVTATSNASTPTGMASTPTASDARDTRRAQSVPAEVEQRFVCPDGGVEEAAELQRAVDQGHQPWRTSPKDVAAACTFGLPDSAVEAVGADTYRVTQVSTGKAVIVKETQPLRTGLGGVWVVRTVTPDD